MRPVSSRGPGLGVGIVNVLHAAPTRTWHFAYDIPGIHLSYMGRLGAEGFMHPKRACFIALSVTRHARRG